MAVISGTQLSCIKQDRILFDDLSFSVEHGGVLHVKGPNGAGKTSLLRIIVGLSQPASGSVFFQQQPLSSVAESFHRSLIYFGHKPGLNGRMSAFDNLKFWSEQHGVAVSEERLFELLALLGLVGREDLPVDRLSAGQQRRVALCRLWLKQQAKIWVLDEPFTALDVDGVALLSEHIRHFVATGGSVILTTHQVLELGCPVKELVLSLSY